MLFSLVLAVASKEVELWQTFDDFAPRRLMDEGEEMEAMEDPEMDGDEEEPLEGDEMNGDLAEEEEEGLNPLMIAVPAAAALAVGGYFLMNQGKKENQEDKPFTERLTMEGLQKDSEVQVAAAAATAVTGLGLYALLGGGGATGPVSTGFLASNAGLATVGLGVPAGAFGLYKGYQWWNNKDDTTTSEDPKLTALKDTQKQKEEALEAFKKTIRSEEQEKTLKALNEKDQLDEKETKQKETLSGMKSADEAKDELAKLKTALTTATTAVTNFKTEKKPE